MPIIEVNHVTKEYRLGQIQSLKTTALNQWRRLTGQPVEERVPFKALDDINLSIEPSEVVGIIGRNGAGKSTMLKLLANISKPSSGSITVKGKIAPLIEVGAGLVGELTGRENIYLNGTILGISKAEIKSKFDDIVAFAELEEFIDTPIKRYSSGMQVRLGFSIATSVESDILIVDEVLAVGDLAFQRKCFERMEDLIKNQGRTVLLVSHNIRQIERLCSRAIFLEHGQMRQDGAPGIVCPAFYDAMNTQILRSTTQSIRAVRGEGTGEIEMVSAEFLSAEDGTAIHTLDMHDPLRIRIRFLSHRALPRAEVIVALHTVDFVHIFSASTAEITRRPDISTGEHSLECQLPDLPLRPSIYGLRVVFFDRNRRPLWWGENIIQIVVGPGKRDLTKMPELGFIDLPLCWRFDEFEVASPASALPIRNKAGA